MTVERDPAMRRILDLDKAACEANSLWHTLESIKREAARAAGFSDRRLRDKGIFVDEEAKSRADIAALAAAVKWMRWWIEDASSWAVGPYGYEDRLVECVAAEKAIAGFGITTEAESELERDQMLDVEDA